MEEEREERERVRIDLHVHGLGIGTEMVAALKGTLDQVLNAVKGLVAQGRVQMKELDDLTSEVTRATTVEESAVTLINGIAAKLAAAGTDPAKLATLHDSLVKGDDALAAAITANTPAAPPTTGTGTSGASSSGSGSTGS